MNEQERLLKEITFLSDSIRKKNRALRLGISERDKYLETTFRPVIEPLKEMSQTVKKFIPSTEGELILPVSEIENKAKKEEPESTDDDEEKENLPSTSDLIKRNEQDEEEVKTEDEEEIEEKADPTSITLLGKDITTFGDLGRKYVLKMLHSTPTTKKYHVYGARLEDDGLKMGNSKVRVDEDDNIWVDNNKFKGTRGLFELIFRNKPENYTRLDLQTFKKICKLSNAHRKLYSPTSVIHKNTSFKYTNIISQLFPPTRVHVKRRAMSSTELNRLLKKRKTVSGEGMFKDSYETNIIYYNNVNKLVTRMRLLHEAMEAGHTGVENEWIALVTELKNKGVIE